MLLGKTTRRLLQGKTRWCQPAKSSTFSLNNEWWLWFEEAFVLAQWEKFLESHGQKCTCSWPDLPHRWRIYKPFFFHLIVSNFGLKCNFLRNFYFKSANWGTTDMLFPWSCETALFCFLNATVLLRKQPLRYLASKRHTGAVKIVWSGPSI